MEQGRHRRSAPAGGLSRLPRAERERIYRRRRQAALAAIAAVFLLLVVAVSSIGGGGGESDTATAEQPPPVELPRGGRVIFPRHRVVGYYGAPQDPELGVLGIGTPRAAARKLLGTARGYERRRRPVLPAFELIATLAHAAPGDDGLHRQRQDDSVIRRYLRAVRRIKGLLILDVQPGRADFFEEVRALEPYLLQPDVSLALDSEWSVPAGVVPGQEIGSTDAATVNRVVRYLAGLVRRRNLPQKLLIVHQFTEGMVENDEELIRRPEVATVLNADGFGTRELKTAVFERLTSGPQARAYQQIGFKLFFQEDTGLMEPSGVLRLHPQPDVVVYE
jgi:hypothetical protein